MAITWKSMAAPDLSSNLAALDKARSSINGGFDIFNNVIKQREIANEAAYQTQELAAKNNFLDQLYAASNPEEFAAQKGQITQSYGGLSAENRGAVRSVLGARPGELSQQQINAINAKNLLAADASKPILEEASRRLSMNDQAGYQEIVKANPGVLGLGQLGQEAQKQALEAEYKRSQIDVNQQQVETGKAEIEAKKSGELFKLFDALKTGTTTSGVPGTKNADGSVNGDSVHKDITALVGKAEPAVQTAYAQNLAKLSADPNNKYLTNDEKAGIALQATESRGFFSRTLGIGPTPSNAEDLAAKLRASPEHQNRVAKIIAAEENALKNQQALMKTFTERGSSSVSTAPIDKAAAAAPVSVPAEGSRSFRNNNPGNIKFNPDLNNGAVGKDKDGFAIFPSREVGDKAHRTLLQGKNYRDLSISDAIARYAPAADNNDVSAYSKAIASTGLDVRKKISDLSPAEFDTLVSGMQKHEGWYSGNKSTPTPTPAEAAAAIKAPTPTTTLAEINAIDRNSIAALDTAAAKVAPKANAALPDYDGKPVATESILTSAKNSIISAARGISETIGKNSSKNNAQSTAIMIKELLDSNSYISKDNLAIAVQAYKQHPDQFAPKVKDWLAQVSEAQKKTLR